MNDFYEQMNDHYEQRYRVLLAWHTMIGWQCVLFRVWFFFPSFRPIQSTMSLSAMPLSMTYVRRQPAFPSRLRAWMLFWQFLCSLPFIQTGDRCDIVISNTSSSSLRSLLNVEFQVQTCLFNIQQLEMAAFLTSCLGCITNALDTQEPSAHTLV